MVVEKDEVGIVFTGTSKCNQTDDRLPFIVPSNLQTH